jgi:predicted nucleic-acid-binding Zn-ribbon protein
VRIRCVLFGCWCDEHSACPKCGAQVYDGDYIQIGKMDWMFKVRDLFKGTYRFVNRRCDVCGKRMLFTYKQNVCSDSCFDKWIPF